MKDDTTSLNENVILSLDKAFFMSVGHLALHLSHLQREKGKDKEVRELWTRRFIAQVVLTGGRFHGNDN